MGEDMTVCVQLTDRGLVWYDDRHDETQIGSCTGTSRCSHGSKLTRWPFLRSKPATARIIRVVTAEMETLLERAQAALYGLIRKPMSTGS